MSRGESNSRPTDYFFWVMEFCVISVTSSRIRGTAIRLALRLDCKTARYSVFDFFIDISVMVRNAGVANGVDLTLRKLTRRSDSPVAALQARIPLRRQNHSAFATILGVRDWLRECNVVPDQAAGV